MVWSAITAVYGYCVNITDILQKTKRMYMMMILYQVLLILSKVIYPKIICMLPVSSNQANTLIRLLQCDIRSDEQKVSEASSIFVQTAKCIKC